MKNILNTIFVVCLSVIVQIHVANAVNCEDYNNNQSTCETNGCIYTTISETVGTCESCPDGKYRAYDDTTQKYTCVPCTNGPANMDDSSIKCGAENAWCQYTSNGGDADNCSWEMTCPLNKPGFEHGTWEPDSGTITYTGTGEAPQCTYTNPANITCDSTGGRCNMGFELSGEACVDIVRTCQNGTIQGLIFPNDPTDTCYYKSGTCPNGYVFIPQNQSCGSDTYGICIEETITCNTSPKAPDMQQLCTDKSGNFSVGTPITFDANIGDYNYSPCTCTTTPDVENGSAEDTCHFTSGGDRIETTCNRQFDICNSGYCSTNNGTPNATCDLAQKGYYQMSVSSTACGKCPAGATTDGTGSIGIGSCHYTSRTVFKDDDGRPFTLPTDNITVKWNWQ